MRSHRFPPYPARAHKSGAARIVINGKHTYLGRHGSDESWTEYRRLMAEWQAARTGAAVVREPDTLTIYDLVGIFRLWVESYYRDNDGRQTAEVTSYKMSLLPVLSLYGNHRVVDFGPTELKAVREAMMDGSWMSAEMKETFKKAGRRIDLCRRVINQRVNRIKRMFRWGVSEELVSADCERRIASVDGLAAGRSRAREKPEVLPVPIPVVQQTLPHLGPVVSAMVRLQMLTGMRPGEICQLRWSEIDRDGLVVGETRIWVYRPRRHKSKWRGHKKAVVIGPRAQEVLLAFERDPETPIFSPREEVMALRQLRADPRGPGIIYTVGSYGKRIRSVCDWKGIPRWTPHQLRHLAEVEYQRAFGLDAARAVLGHRSAQQTLAYGVQDLETAALAASKIG